MLQLNLQTLKNDKVYFSTFKKILANSIFFKIKFNKTKKVIGQIGGENMGVVTIFSLFFIAPPQDKSEMASLICSRYVLE